MISFLEPKSEAKLQKSVTPSIPLSSFPHVSTPLVPSSISSLDNFHLLITHIIRTTVTRRCQLRHMFHIVLSKSVAQKSLFIPAMSLISLSSVPRMRISFHAAEVCVCVCGLNVKMPFGSKVHAGL